MSTWGFVVAMASWAWLASWHASEPGSDCVASTCWNTAERCPETAAHCLGITLHVVHIAGRPVGEPAWVHEQIATANRHFAAIEVAFELATVEAIGSNHREVVTRLDRDRLGRHRFTNGTIHVFVVEHLADVDAAGIIRGVHWRDRRDTTKRWIILSTAAMPGVLAHELGHFFGLPHSTHRASIMNKRPHLHPPWAERSFVPSERQKMTRRAKELIQSGALLIRSRA